MKKGLSLFLSLIMALGVITSMPRAVSAASETSLSFTLSNNGTYYYISDCSLNASGRLVIPSTYNNKPVKSIGYKAFYDCDDLETIYIPNSVTSIGDYAFSSCSGLTTITIPDSVTSIGKFAFEYCDNIGSVKIGNSVTSIPAYAFSSCSGLTSITLPENITCIGNGAFSDCTNLTSITIPQSVTRIGGSTFSSCSGLTSVTIPDSVTTIGNYAFKDCKKLKYVFYIGTQEDWLTIDIGSDNSVLTDAKIHYETSGHITADWAINTVATCTKNGLKSKTCSICGNVETETIPAYGHTKSNWITDKKATVNAAGKKHKECTECGEVLETETIKQLKCSIPRIKTIANTQSGVKITWGKVSGADKYDVYRKTGSGKYTKIGTTTKTYYTDKKASSGKTYSYYVKAVNEAGSSSASSSKTIKHLADPTLKTPSSTKSGVKLTWNKITGAQGYMVYRKTGSGSYSKIATVKGSTKVTYTDKSAKKGKKYTYKVKAYYSKTYSAYSNTKTITDKY